MINALTGNTAPQTYPLIAREGVASLDVDRNGQIDENDSYLRLQTQQGPEWLSQEDLMAALRTLRAQKEPVSAQSVVDQLKVQYSDASLVGLEIVNGSFNFEQLSTYRHQQTFQIKGDQIEYTLQFDPSAPLETLPDGRVVEGKQDSGAMLVRDQDGVLNWVFPEPPAPPPPPAGAVTEPTLVERDGILHWLFPGEVPQEGDKIRGDANSSPEQLLGLK